MRKSEVAQAGQQPAGAFKADTRHYSATMVIDAFRKAMLEHLGCAPDIIDADGKLHRFSTNGRADDKSGRYCLHLDGRPAGYFQCYRQDVKRTWTAGRDLLPDETPEEMALRQQQAAATKARKAREESQKQKDTADRAANIWKFAKPVYPDFPYLVRKNIKPNGARLSGMALINPMYDSTGKIWNLQRIFSDGTKRFLTGARKIGLFTVLGGVKLATAERALVVEGWATGCTVSAIEPGTPVIVAFDAGNLAPVVGAIVSRYPGLRLVIVADDDRKAERSRGKNVGIEKAMAAAAQYPGVSVVVPDFPINAPIELSDVNDLVSWRVQQGSANHGD